jgi:hypothetical protein
MKQMTDPINVRIEWCRRQSAQARTEPEMEGWRAEADGLQDALMNHDHSHNYRLCPPEIFRRYVLGFQDGTALLRAARVQRAVHGASTGTPRPVFRRGSDVLVGDDR